MAYFQDEPKRPEMPDPSTVTPPSAPRPPAMPGGQTRSAFDTAFDQQKSLGEQDPTYSADQWQAWRKEENDLRSKGGGAQNCPPNMPFTSRPGPNGERTCAFKPDDCPDGSHIEGSDTNGSARCVPNGTGGGPNGAGGGAGGGGFGGGTGMDLASDSVWNAIMARLNGGTRYTPEVMDSLMGQIKGTAEAQASNQRDEAMADAAARGMIGAGATGATMRGIRANVGNQVLAGKNQLIRAKIDADYQDKTEAIKSGIEWLNSLRDYVSRMAATQAQKEAAMANITLGYARLSQEMDMMREEFAQRIASGQLGM